MSKPLLPIEGRQPDPKNVENRILHRANKITIKATKRYIEAIKLGLSPTGAAAYVGVDKRTIDSWLDKGSELSEEDGRGYYSFWVRVQKARGKSEKDLVDIVTDAAREGEWKAAAWMLERRFPKDWGKKTEVNQNTSFTLASLIQHTHVDSLPESSSMDGGSVLDRGGEMISLPESDFSEILDSGWPDDDEEEEEDDAD